MITRTVHTLTVLDDVGVHLLWHRYDDGILLPAGYTAHADVWLADWERMFPGSTILADCISAVRSLATSLVEEHERHTWWRLGIDSIDLAKAHLQWPQYGPEYSYDNPADMELEWHRIRNGERLPRWCFGTLLYEFLQDDQGWFCKISGNKGISRTLVARVIPAGIAMLQAAVPVADALDEYVGWR